MAQPAPTPGTFRPTAYYSYDANNNVTAYCDPVRVHAAGKDWTSRPAPSDTLCSTANNLSQFSQFTWTTISQEPFGELTVITKPLGYNTTIHYNTAPQGGTDYGLPTSVVGDQMTQDDNTQITPTQSFYYDVAGNLVCYNKGNGLWVLTYDGSGRQTAVADPDDASLAAPSVCGTKTPGLSGSHIQTTTMYYSAGSVKSVQSPSEYAAGQTIKTQYDYDIDSNQTLQTRHYGNVAGQTNKYYDGADRLVEVKLPPDASVLGDGFRSDYYGFPWMTRYFYDLTQHGAFGSIVLNGSTVFAYGNLFKTQEYLNSTWTDSKANAYDALDRVTLGYNYGMSTTQGSTITYDTTTDSVGYPRSACNAAAQCVVDSYDAIGRETQASFTGNNAPAARTYQFDADGRTVSVSQQPFGTQTYSFDADGRLGTSQEPTGGGVTSAAKLTYLYYANGWKSGLSVDPVTTGFTQHNIFSYNYQTDGLLKGQQYAYAGSFQPGTYSFNFSYTAGGRQLSRSDIFPSGLNIGTTQNTYDTYGRVATLTIPAGTYSQFNYDAEKETTSYMGYGYSSAWSNVYNVRGELVTGSGLNTGTFNTVPNYLHGANGFMYPSQFQGRYLLNGTTFNALTSAITHTPQIDQTWQYDAAGRQTVGSDDYFVSHVEYFGSLTRSFDPENHQLSQDYTNWGFVSQCGGGNNMTKKTLNMSYQWGPNGHPLLVNNETLHWDGNSVLFTTNASGTVDDIKVGMLADVTPTDPGWAGLTVWDRNQSGMVESSHNWSGHDAWLPEAYFHPMFCGTIDVPAAKNSWASQFTPAQKFATMQNSALNNVYLGNGGWLYEPGADGYLDGFTIIQGARIYDSSMSSWTTPDPYAGEDVDPVSQKPYMWNKNNPTSYSDPTGFCSDPGVSGVRTCTDFFIAAKTAVGSFWPKLAGDNRPFGNFAPGQDSFRARVDVHFKTRDVAFRVAESHDAKTGRSVGSGALLRANATWSGNSVHIQITAQCGAPLCSIGPVIAADFTQTLNPDGSITTAGTRPRYPSMEIWSYDNSGKPTVIYTGGEVWFAPLGLKEHEEFNSNGGSEGLNTCVDCGWGRL